VINVNLIVEFRAHVLM